MDNLPALLSVDAIRTHECRAFRTWPAATMERLDGWILRFNDGVTHRANSVFTVDFPEGSDAAAAIAAAEAFFAAHGQPPCFMISPASIPRDLDRRLAARGYGGAVLGALAAWAESVGAANLFLQVTASNGPAIRLYDKAGFRTVYGYHYRLAP